MTERSVAHRMLTIERHYPVAPARVFAAWAVPETKIRWFHCKKEWPVEGYVLDFRVGGAERLRTGPAGGTVHRYEATYLDIVADQRIVFAFAMQLDAIPISVSLATVTFAASGGGTAMTFTEQVTFLDGYDDLDGREHGTAIGFDNLARLLAD